MSNMSRGSQGPHVAELQNVLNQAGFDLDEDGIFGRRTEAAVRHFQTDQGLDVDGIVGPHTKQALVEQVELGWAIELAILESLEEDYTEA
jgi:peptidoglycan hydrolase-like protein with peptidoglycan-binding domain